MDVIKQVILFFVTPRCYDEYFFKFNFLDVECFKSTLSKGLGFGIILGSILVKLPQILKIIQNKSGEGINLLSVTMDLSAITIYLSYSYLKEFPFTSWGDSAFLAVQTVVIGALVLFYAGETLKSIGYMMVYMVITFILAGGITPVSVLWTFQGFNIPILVTSKLLQAYTNYKNGNTGQLSAVTLLLLFMGALARIFTSIQETGDNMVIITHSASAFVNAILVIQLWYYWDVDSKVHKLQKKTE